MSGMLSALTLRFDVSCVNIRIMKKDAAYHHGDLRATLIRAASVELERAGYESLSLRELAASADVSRAAPYRHFADRRALLAVLAGKGFRRLTALYRKAIRTGKTPTERLAVSGRLYLALAARRPQLFRLMFASDLLTDAPRDPDLIEAAGECYKVFEGIVAATLDVDDENAIKAATIAVMSSTYGFALLQISGRIKPFMSGGLSQSDLVETILSMKVTTLPGAERRTDRRTREQPGAR